MSHPVSYTAHMTRQEHYQSPELDPHLLEQYSDTFLNNRDFYPRQTSSGSYYVVGKPPHAGVLIAHLKGLRVGRDIMTIGAYALSPNHTAKWLCLDADTDDQWERLKNLASNLLKQDISPYMEPSRRGGHLWLFTQPIAGKDIRRFGRQLLSEANIDGVELYPKQDQLVTGPGSLVRLPLGIHHRSGKRYHFVNLDGTPVAPTVRAQIQMLADPIRVPQSFIQTVLDRVPEEPPLVPSPIFAPGSALGEKVSDRIKARMSVQQFVSQYVALDERGHGYCPFHEDQHRSFGVNQDRNFWHCYAGCGGGSIIDFWMKMRERQGLEATFTATVTELAHLLLL